MQLGVGTCLHFNFTAIGIGDKRPCADSIPVELFFRKHVKLRITIFTVDLRTNLSLIHI